MVVAGDKKILVVDDEVSVLAMLKETLTSARHKVRTAKNAAEAVKSLKQRPSWQCSWISGCPV
ncbi:MAG: hypothetical protein ABSE05_04490 [Syntrophales bacterium]|jgi:DNA-binding NtrC family response regulator